ncbi:MAG TPA: hypothetical protein VMB52_02810 [Verrucomicrobiae bacterium]|nr:hypothetical protein [Verrucomicrobiae bacterium]
MVNPEDTPSAEPTNGQGARTPEELQAALSDFTTPELLAEALRRGDGFLDEDGKLTEVAFRLADALAIRVCVDGIAARLSNKGEVELMAIVRNTGPYEQKLALVGGGVGRVSENGKWLPESFSEALDRHFRDDLGYAIEPLSPWWQPDYVAQDMRPVHGEVRAGFTPNPNSRHLIAARFLVAIVGNDQEPLTFGSTRVGGQEASGVVWFSKESMPDSSYFGYGHHETYSTLFPVAERYLEAA